MSTLTSLIRLAPKRLTDVVAMVAAAIIIPAAVFAWGPDRQLYTVTNPADKITFNSITDNPVAGDETNFVVVKDAANTNDGGWTDNQTVEAGKEYLVRMYVHNNAASSLNLTAINTRVSASVPTTTGKNVSVSGFVTADNSDPLKVWDDIHFNSTQDFNLVYVPGSAEIYNNGYAKDGATLPDSIVTSNGALVGYEGPNGEVPGCFQYSNWVYFKVKPQFAETSKFEVKKMVSKHGENKWAETYKAQPSEVVDFIVGYKNTGEVQHNDVTFRDTLPAGLTYVEGSTTWSNASTQNVKTSDNLVNGVGINVGSYAPGANAYVVFSAKVSGNATLPVCGPNTLINSGSATTAGGSMQDTANVTVTKECAPGKINVCELESKKIITINEDQFDANKHTKDLSKCEVPELPQTGPTENIVAIVGLGALIASIAYYVASRRALNQ